MSDFDLASLGDDFTQYERTTGTGGSNPLPLGFYSGIVTRVDMKETKNKTGKYLEVEFDITSPSEHSNRKFWDKFNVVNTNPTAVKIAKEQLGDLLKAMGFSYSPNTDELSGREVCMYIAIEPARGTFSASNKCLKYLPVGSTEADYKAWLDEAKSKAKEGGAGRKTWGNQAAPAEQASTKAKPAWKRQS